MKEYQRIAVSRQGRILTLTLTGANPVNAVDAAMHHEIGRAHV